MGFNAAQSEYMASQERPKRGKYAKPKKVLLVLKKEDNIQFQQVLFHGAKREGISERVGATLSPLQLSLFVIDTPPEKYLINSTLLYFTEI